jgi:hypothetical protein
MVINYEIAPIKIPKGFMTVLVKRTKLSRSTINRIAKAETHSISNRQIIKAEIDFINKALAENPTITIEQLINLN